MNTPHKKNKSFILAIVLCGLVQVTCGFLMLASVMGYWGHKFPLNNHLVVVAASLSYIIGGKCTMAFSYFRGKALMIAVIVFSVLSVIFGAIQFIFLILSHSQKKTLLCDGTTETVICLGSIFNTVFFSAFSTSLHFTSRRRRTPPHHPMNQVNLSRDTLPPSYDQVSLYINTIPPPYHQVILDTDTLPPPYDQVNLDYGNQESYDATSPPPSYTHDMDTLPPPYDQVILENKRATKPPVLLLATHTIWTPSHHHTTRSSLKTRESRSQLHNRRLDPIPG